jgi:hypothetical protein
MPVALDEVVVSVAIVNAPRCVSLKNQLLRAGLAPALKREKFAFTVTSA